MLTDGSPATSGCLRRALHLCSQDEEHSSLPLAPLIARLQLGTPLSGAQLATLWPDAAREAARGGGLSDELVLRVREAVSRGGVEPALRRELCQFLLGASYVHDS